MDSSALLAVGAFAACTGFFGWRQNRGGVVGGPISLPKILWLNLTLTVFFGLPFVLWRDAALSPGVRLLFGWLLLSFVGRAVIELYLIYVTITWKCVYGISHDLFTLAMAAALRLGLSPAAGDSKAMGFLAVYCAVLLIEAGMAKAFSLLADPKTGIYFASDDPRFKKVNAASWAASLCGYAALAALLFL
ncbi:MAG: hypothetical protein HYZ75_12975 [Elusimicrobia bacterium]|nr:hypothetical protein [Elusimicrobiota bacterium]